MGLAALDAALSGLRVSQQALSVISNNVANVGTPGFTRKLLPQNAVSLQGVTVGVRAETIIRQVDLNLERDLWTQVSAVGFLDVQQTYLQRIETFHGPPDAELSIAAELARLQDAFGALANSPEDAFLQAGAVTQAVDTADKINNLSALITQLRNDAQDETEITVNEINDLLDLIAELNDQIQDNITVGRSTALLEDQRDEAIKDLSELIEISFFTRGDGVLVVQTNEGVELASNFVTHLTFNRTPLSATTFYPDSINGVFVGDPTTDPQAVDITLRTPGGKLGGLLDLRDNIFQKQMAQLDEMAHKMALRFEAQGLRLFTDASGNIPLDTAPDPTAGPPETPVEYVGFSAVIEVNQAILADNTLVQQGTATTDLPVQQSSNEVPRRVVEFVFGDVDFQQAVGVIDMQSFATGGVDLQNWLGVFSDNTVTGGRALSSFADIPTLVNSADNDLDAPDEEFQITFEELRNGTGSFTVTINMSTADANFPIGGPIANALDQIVAEINNQIALAGVPASLNAVASNGPNGEIILDSTGTIIIDGSFGPTGMTQQGLDFLGFIEDTYPPTDPYFDIQVGNDPIQRIFIEPGDTEAELIDKLILNVAGDAFNAPGDTTGVPGLAYDETTFLLTGELILRPGDDFINPEFGGDLKIIGGPFTVDPAAAASPDIAAIANGVNIASALFGSFDPVNGIPESSPITSVGYESVIDASLPGPPFPSLPFRETLLGPGVDISTGIIGTTRLIDYAQKMVNEHTQELILTQKRIQDEDTLKETLQRTLLDESGVNLDEELSNMIVVQTAFSAAARVVTAVDEMFRELLAAVR